jgi:hypothetical protein
MRKSLIWAWGLALCAWPLDLRADGVGAAVYVRTDTDHTTVVSPHASAQTQLTEDVLLDARYSADVWSSASIDIRASASVRPVTEQRDEINVGVARTWSDFQLRGGYRFSTEPDYRSHGGTLSLQYDLAGKAATLRAGLNIFGDSVGRSGDPGFWRTLVTYDTQLSYTQLIDPLSFVQLTYELAHNRGYQASPYRFVGSGPDATGFGCLDAQMCWAERVPRERTRHAFALLGRRALSDVLSAGLTYRFYVDDWTLWSHTLLAELSCNVLEHGLLSVRYRFYYQSGVSFYRARYEALSALEHRTRDRELSPMLSHRLGIDYEHRLAELAAGRRLTALLALGGNYYDYRDFVGLSSAWALEVTAALSMTL